ncbi:hypothetical protein SKAU_G00192590 [Synaphobranchus kaupii]|uniref:Ribosome receptor lysine/proline rich domain-containing protein n=1 Tax=Synaphobranchus kaupii TaxID=118154 RepID=A0A9Q1FE89_SYNKA|nr:hypothetical protein SKAU_G00192590 [Synaphobranchus kaupii]
MAVDLLDSQYVLVLAPSLLLTLMFLFFRLFVREASYDEALARYRRQLRPPPTRPDACRKADRKKSKKKEDGVAGVGDGAGREGDSDSGPRDFDLTDAVVSSEEQLLPAPETADAPLTLRERKKEKKHRQPASCPALLTTCPTPLEELGPMPISVSRPVSIKSETPIPITRPPSPPPAEPVNKKGSLRKQRIEPAGVTNDLQLDSRVGQDQAPDKKEASVSKETKPQDGPTAPAAHTSTTGSRRRKSSYKKQKADPALVDEPPIQASVYIPLMDSDPVTPSHPQNEPKKKMHTRKQKNEADKERLGLKRMELLAGLHSLHLSTEEVANVATVLRERNPSALEDWHRELQTERQKVGWVEALLREQRRAAEQELSAQQAKAQGSHQEMQAAQMKFQQLRGQLEEQASHLQQENKILRDAVSRASNQRECEQSAALRKLHTEKAALMLELQQEELRRKAQEAQLHDAKRRWEDVQGFLRSVSTEREQLQAAKQELKNQLLSVESEMNSKNQEIQTLHGSLTDAMVSKEQLEHRVLELLDSTECGRPKETPQVQDLLTENKALRAQMEALQARIGSQATTLSHFEELQRLLAEKEIQRKSLEDSLNAERSSGAVWESDLQAMHTENLTLKAELQSLRAQISEQAAAQLILDQLQKSVQEKDVKIKSVEELLEVTLVKMAAKEKELEVREEELKPSSQSTVEQLRRMVQEMEERLLAELEIRTGQEETIQAMEKQVEALRADVERARLRDMEETTCSSARLQELQKLLAERDSCLSELQRQGAELRQSLEVQRKKNNELREKNWTAMEALSVTESLLQGKLVRNAKESQKALESVEMECREVLHRLLPTIPLPSSQVQNHREWLQKFEHAAKEAKGAEPTPAFGPGSEATKIWEEKLRESVEAQKLLHKDCETYKKILGETEGILKRLQSSVEEEVSWKVKLMASQEELKELKAQLTETLCRLDEGQRQGQKAAGDLCEAQRSLDLIQVETQKESLPVDLIETNCITTQKDGQKTC